MPKPPLPVRDVLQYLLLEDAEDLAPASIKYIGSAQDGGVLKHYWSFPGHDQVQWACLVNGALVMAYEVPDTIRQPTAPFAEHVKRKPPPQPPNA